VNNNNNNKKGGGGGKKKFQVKTGSPVTEKSNNNTTAVVNNRNSEGTFYEVTIKNLETNSVLGAPLKLNQVELDSFFPPDIRGKLVDVRS